MSRKPKKPAAKPDTKPMNDEDVQGRVHRLITNAITFVDGELTPVREELTNLYHGEKLGNEEEGRSQVVMTEVRDGVNAVLPDLLDIFFGPELVVEYEPRGPEDEEAALQATAYIHKAFLDDNRGYLITREVLIDGLVRRLGVFKWGWEEGEVKAARLVGVTQSELELLAAEEDVVDVTHIEQTKAGVPAPEGAEPVEAEFTVELTRRSPGRLIVDSVPPEEFIFTKDARDEQSAMLIGHRTELTRSELLKLGVPAADIDEHGTKDETLDSNEDRVAREDAVGLEGGATGEDEDAGPENEKILYVEAWTPMDVDGDGVAELRQVCTIGPGYHVVKNVPATDAPPFALFSSDPEPHSLNGRGQADKLKDLQYIMSAVMRGTLDSLVLSLFPRQEVVEELVNMEDVLNTDLAAPIRVRKPGMVREIKSTFAGGDTLPLMQYLNDVNERRTGQNKGAAGLDADALQSTTKAAVGAAVTAAQRQKKHIAMTFAEMTLKPLFRGLLRTYVANAPKKQTMRLRGEWVPMDPRSWNADMDVSVNVALGMGSTEEKLGALAEIASKQELMITTLGPNNPLVGLPEYRYTIAKAIELMGYKNSSKFIKELPPGWEPPQAPPEPSPEMALVQLEAQKAQVAAQQKAMELELKQRDLEAQVAMKGEEAATKFDLELQRLEMDRMKMEQEFTLKARELELKYSTQIEEARLRAEVDRAVAADKLAIEREKNDGKQALEEERTRRDAERADAVAEHDADVKERQLEQQRTAGAAKNG